jgi:hypothetical protein
MCPGKYSENKRFESGISQKNTGKSQKITWKIQETPRNIPENF